MELIISFASDLWSIGVLLYKIAFGKYPYGGNGPVEIYMKIMSGPKKLEKSGDKNFDDLIDKLLQKEKEKRITYPEYFNHPFFKYDEPKSIINLNKNYDLNISSYNREFRTESKKGNILLKEIGEAYFVKLKELNLQFCGISDLSPLTGEIFKNLIFLNLQYNQISDLSPLQKIKFLNIIEMYFGMNNIKNITPLKSIAFKCLKVISFSGNPINWDENNQKLREKLLSK